MSSTRHSRDNRSRTGNPANSTGRAGADVRKQGLLRTAVTATATATGLALAVPLGAPAEAELTPQAMRSLHLDAATQQKVQAYDEYRTREKTQRKKAKKALRFARKQIGKPYRWGAAGPDGYDCSGLAMAAWRKAGVKIPRVTYAQYRKVDRKVKYAGLEPGDLIFFHGRSHVGLYVGHGRFLHAPHSGAQVRIDKISKWRKRQFAGAVRPGAPAYREWSPSVKELAEKIDRMSVEKSADRKPPDKERTPQIPPPADSPRSSHDTSPQNTPEQTPAKQAAPPGGPAPEPDDSAAKAPRSDKPSDKTKPIPRPRTEAAFTAISGRRSFQYRVWAKYTGYPPFGILA